MNDPHPYSRLTPDVVLNALERVGLRCDGRLLALNSYENRVYQVGIEDDGDASLVVAKFYRPARWSDAQILEEHAFAAELAEAEIPVVAPLAFDGAHAARAEGFRFAVFPRRGGRAPELEDRDDARMARPLHRPHPRGRRARAPSRTGPRIDIASFGEEPRDFLLASGFIPARPASSRGRRPPTSRSRACAHAFERAGDVRHAAPARRLPRGQRAVDARHRQRAGRPALRRPRRRAHGPRGAGPVDAGLGRPRRRWAAQLGQHPARATRTSPSSTTASCTCVEALRTLRLLHYSAWLARRWDDPAFPIAFPFFNTPRYWQDRVLELREQIAAMQEPPLVPRRSTSYISTQLAGKPAAQALLQ